MKGSQSSQVAIGALFLVLKLFWPTRLFGHYLSRRILDQIDSLASLKVSGLLKNNALAVSLAAINICVSIAFLGRYVMATPIVTLEIPGTPTIILRQKVDITIGRGDEAHIQFIDPAVSRIHATIKWGPSETYPILSDSNSYSGLQVDDQYVEWKHLHHVHIILIGSKTIRAIFHEDKRLIPKSIDLKGVMVFPPIKKKENGKIEVGKSKIKKIGYFDDVMPFTYKSDEERAVETAGMEAILKELDTVDGVILFKNYGKPDEKGRICGNRQLHQLLTFLEEKERTGTLTLYGEHNAELTFASGRIRRATCGMLTDMAAVQHIFMFPSAGFNFSYSCEVGEAAIDLEPTSYLRQITKHVTKAVARPSKRLSKLFDEPELIGVRRKPGG